MQWNLRSFSAFCAIYIEVSVGKRIARIKIQFADFLKTLTLLMQHKLSLLSNWKWNNTIITQILSQSIELVVYEFVLNPNLFRCIYFVYSFIALDDSSLSSWTCSWAFKLYNPSKLNRVQIRGSCAYIVRIPLPFWQKNRKTGVFV